MKVCNEGKKESEQTKSFLSGYSQGAYGVNDLVNIWERGFGTEVSKVLAGVFLIANPAEPNTGAITAIDSISEKKGAYSTSLTLCGVSATTINTVLVAIEEASRAARVYNDARNLLSSGIKTFKSFLANPLKILGLSNGPQKNDTEFSKGLEKTLKKIEKAAAESRKNANLEDQPLCQLMFMKIILEAYDRKLETPRDVNVHTHFSRGDIIADALPIFKAAKSAAQVAGVGAGGLAAGVAGAGVVVAGSFIHTSYKRGCSWAQDAITKVVGPETPQIHAQGSFVEPYLPESHPCRKS